MGLDVSKLSNLPAIIAPVVAAGADGERKFAVVDVPAMGFAWIGPAKSPAGVSRAKPIAAGNVLANEFLELTVSRSTGGIQSVYDFNRRGNQLSQQLAFRLPAPAPVPGEPWRDPDAEATYSSMRAEAVEIAAASSAFGEITSRGTLVDAVGRTLATFRQTVELWAGSRSARLVIELDPVEEPRADPWNSYFAARFAWAEESAELARGVGAGSPNDRKRPARSARIHRDRGCRRNSHDFHRRAALSSPQRSTNARHAARRARRASQRFRVGDRRRYCTAGRRGLGIRDAAGRGVRRRGRHGQRQRLAVSRRRQKRRGDALVGRCSTSPLPVRRTPRRRMRPRPCEGFACDCWRPPAEPAA